VKINNARVHGDREGRKETEKKEQRRRQTRDEEEEEKRGKKGRGLEKKKAHKGRLTSIVCSIGCKMHYGFLGLRHPHARYCSFVLSFCAFFFFSVKYKGDGEQREREKKRRRERYRQRD
jgi:hypothetical protein